MFRGGDSAVESSEDEKEEGQQVDPLDAGDLLNLDDDSGAAPFEASAQFCRALDREDEFDANDCIADAIDLEEERPERHTQVLISISPIHYGTKSKVPPPFPCSPGGMYVVN